MLRDVSPEETDGEMGVRSTTESRSEDQSRMKSEVSGLYWPPTVLRARLRTPTPHKLTSERLASERLASEQTTEEIEDTETLEERSTMLDNHEILMYENLVKAQRVAKLKREFEGLVAEESVYSGKADLRQQGMRDNRGRRVDMLKVEVGIFRRAEGLLTRFSTRSPTSTSPSRPAAWRPSPTRRGLERRRRTTTWRLCLDDSCPRTTRSSR